MEKRSEKRIEDSVARIFECHDDPRLVGESFACDVIDFSSRGVRLQTSYALVPDTLLNITLGVGRPVSRFQLRGKILWTEILGSNCHLGVYFLEDNKTDLNSWMSYVDLHFAVTLIGAKKPAERARSGSVFVDGR
jgi:hypothetical protein